MNAQKEAARHRCDDGPRQMSLERSGHVDYTPRDYARGAAVAGLSTVLMFGACLIHWAVM